MTDAKPNDIIEPAVTTPAQRYRLLGLFLVVVAVFLVGDLWLKAWSFEHIADQPLRVTATNDGPDVWLPGESGEDDWVRAERADPDHPATAIPRHEPTVVVPGVLNMQLTLNTGAVFGLGKGQRWLFVVVSLIATVVIFVLVWRSPPGAWAYPIALGMILSGALGNLYDRVRFSAVRDMLHMLPETGLWPWIFNLADVALVVGVLLVLVLSFWAERARSKTGSAHG